MTTRTLKIPEIEYPSSDGRPMAETDAHRDKMYDSIHRLQRFFSGRKVYVSGNLLIYYVEGDPRKSVAPDTFVVKNCRPRRRKIFQIWKERRKPNVALEITSKTTRREDAVDKKKTFAAIGIKEYFLYDPFGEWLTPPLQGFRLVKGDYQKIPPDADGGVISKELGIRFIIEDGDLAMFDAATGERLLTNDEWEKERADEASRQADEATRQADEATRQATEATRQATEATRQADEAARQAAEATRQAAEATRRAAEEKRSRELAEQKARMLEEELARLKESTGK